MKSRKPHTSPPKGSRSYVIWAIIVAGIVLVATLRERMGRSVPTESSPIANSTNFSPPAAKGSLDFHKLKGRWLRPDGGYVIEIKSVDDNGKLDAGYFNPRPIHVGKAEAKQEGSATKVFIELQDVNYPGSTYTLTYVPERDLLAGVYYQALQKLSFEVYFERMK